MLNHVALCWTASSYLVVKVMQSRLYTCTVQLTGNLTLARSRLASTRRVLASCEDCTREGGANTREYVRVQALKLDARSLSVRNDRSTTASGRFLEGLVVDRAV